MLRGAKYHSVRVGSCALEALHHHNLVYRPDGGRVNCSTESSCVQHQRRGPSGMNKAPAKGVCT
jgi:hypothetical protein